MVKRYQFTGYIFSEIQRLFIAVNYLTIKRILNLCRLGLSYLLSVTGRQKTSAVLPSFVSVETSNYCNLHCPECPVGMRQIPKTGHAHFDLTLYKKLINEQKSTLLHVILYFQGEPLLNKQLTEFIQYAHDAKIYTSTSTNGQLLNKKNAKNIVLSGLDKLIVSVDGSTQETYESYRIGGKLDKTLDGIRELVYWKNELKSVTPLLEIQFIVLKTNEHQLNEMKKLAKTLRADRLTFKTAQLYDFVNGNARLTSIDKYARYKHMPDGKYMLKGSQPNRCWRLWSGAVINAQGEVLPCCFDKASEFSFGNLNEKSFAENWHNKKASGFRESILQNRMQYEMCRNCTSK
ncbi:MAG TPA: radical SAM/SPASM domain-containing protein [Paludibacter sp.]